MNNWVTILTFTYPQEAHLIKTKLQSENIEVFIKDELTTQSNNFLSNAIGGVKLQVKEQDYKQAYLLLKDLGYIKEPKQKANSFFNNFKKKIPFLNKLSYDKRLVIILVFLTLAFTIPITLLSLHSSLSEQITNNIWCIDKLVFQNKIYPLNSTGVKIINDNYCTETISFYKNGIIFLPGLNTTSIKAEWKVTGKNIKILNSDTLGYIYNGLYKVDFETNMIILQSENTKIIGHKNNEIRQGKIHKSARDVNQIIQQEKNKPAI